MSKVHTLRRPNSQEKNHNAHMSNELNITLWALFERAPKHAIGGWQKIGDTLSANHLTCHHHMMPNEEGEDEAFFLSFIIRKIIISFLLTIYNEKGNCKLPSHHLWHERQSQVSFVLFTIRYKSLL